MSICFSGEEWVVAAVLSVELVVMVVSDVLWKESVEWMDRRISDWLCSVAVCCRRICWSALRLSECWLWLV